MVNFQKISNLTSTIIPIIFLFIFITLGFIQPNYNHFRDTVSALVIGKYGWIQTINFLLLSISFALTGYNLGFTLTRKHFNKIFPLFLFFSFTTILIAFLPINHLPEKFLFSQLPIINQIHYAIVFLLILITPYFLFQIIKQIQNKPKWVNFLKITKIILIFNFSTGIVWFFLLNNSVFFNYKGLVQKILITNVLIWLSLVGLKISQLNSTNIYKEIGKQIK